MAFAIERSLKTRGTGHYLWQRTSAELRSRVTRRMASRYPPVGVFSLVNAR
jgi:hypothetical protein